MLLIMHYSVSTNWDVYKTLEMTIWDVLKFDNILSNTINKYSLHVVNNVIFSFNALECL